MSFDRNWGTGGPGCAASGNNFAVRYKRVFATGTYTFTIQADDGVRLSLDGGVTWPLTRWFDSGWGTPISGTFFLSANTNVVLEYYEKTGDARVAITATPVSYLAEIQSMNIGSTSWCAGEVRNVSVTIQNKGTLPWTNTGPDINIGCKWNAEADHYVRVDANNLAPGATQTYTLTMTAPAAGANNLGFDLVNEGACWFRGNSGSCGPGNANAGITGVLSPAITISGPNITTSGTLSAFSACASTTSSAQSFTISASCLTANLVLTAPTGFQISTTSGSGYGSVVTLTPSGGSIATTTIYVVMAPLTSNPAASNISCTSTGATTRNIAVSGSVNAAPTGVDAGTSTSICSGGSIGLTGTFSQTNVSMPTYAASNATSTLDTYISNVTLNSVSTSSSTDATYTNNTAVIINLVQGTSYSISISTADNAGTSYTHGVSAYIDWNADGDFLDAGEQIGTTNLVVSVGARSFVFTCPTSLSSGQRMLRVVATETVANPPSTGTYTFGETEDYTINISSTVSVSWSGGPIVSGNATLTPTVNPTSTTIYTITATSNGCSVSDVVTVNVNSALPTLSSCPGNQTLSAAAGSCTAQASWTAPSWTGCVPTSIPGAVSAGTFGGNYYFYVSSALTWTAARADAVAKGGRLVTIESAAENTFLNNYMIANGIGTSWIGYSDEATEGNFVSVTGVPLSYGNVPSTPYGVYNAWNSIEPNDAAGEDYATITSPGGGWNDLNGVAAVGYFLEYGLFQTAGFANGATNFPVGTTLVTYNAYIPNGVSSTCSFNVTVNSTSTAAISIAVSPSNSICAGANVTFTATPSGYAGTNPSYQWKVNGGNVGTNSASFSTTALTNGQVVTCVMTPDFACPASATVTSNSITMTVTANLPVNVVITAAPAGAICAGSNVTFTATPTNGGTPSYQWKLDGTNVGTNSSTFSSATLTNGNVVTCVMTSNATPCIAGSPATSNSIAVTVNAVPLPPQALSNISAGPVATVNGTALLPDANITANSCWTGCVGGGHESWRGRLFNQGAGTQAWASGNNNLNNTEYLQFDLKGVQTVKGVSTQGRGDCCPQTVATYIVQYSQNGSSWTTVPGVFTGNVDQNTVVTNTFTPVLARYVRIYPQSIGGGHMSMRADVSVIPCSGGIVSMSSELTANSTNVRWYDVASAGTPLSSNQYYTTPSLLTDKIYYAESYNSTSGCASATRTAITAQVASATNVIAGSASSTCIVSGNNWVHFLDNTGKLIVSINPGSNNLGSVTAESYDQGSPVLTQACNTGSNANWTTAVLGRSWKITPQFNLSAQIRFPLEESKLSSLYTAANGTNLNPRDNISSATAHGDLKMSRYSGANQNGSWSDNCSGGGTLLYNPVAATGGYVTVANGFPSTIATTKYVQFSTPGFSEFWLHGDSNGSPLPVSLTAFSATCNDKNEVNVSWTTESEQNSQKFIVEKSRDLNQWIFVSELEAAGNSTTEINYSTTDIDPYSGISYYRLVQVDFDGAEQIYSPISVSCSDQNSNMIVFPNPTKGDFTVEITSAENLNDAEVQLTDLTGKVISWRIIDLVEGKNHILFDESNLQMGTYLVRLVSSKEIKTVKVVVD